MRYAKMNPDYATPYNITSLKEKVTERMTVHLTESYSEKVYESERPTISYKHRM